MDETENNFEKKVPLVKNTSGNYQRADEAEDMEHREKATSPLLFF